MKLEFNEHHFGALSNSVPNQIRMLVNVMFRKRKRIVKKTIEEVKRGDKFYPIRPNINTTMSRQTNNKGEQDIVSFTADY